MHVFNRSSRVSWLLAAAFCLVALPLAAGDGGKDEKAETKPKAKATNPFLAAAGEGARETDEGEPVTLSNEDLDDRQAVDTPLPDAPEPTPVAPAAKRDDGRALSFDNDDLKAMFGEAPAEDDPATADTASAEAPEGTDPLEWMRQRQEATADRATAIAEAETRVASAERQVKDLEAKLLALRNPLLARRVADRKADADAEEEKKAEYEGADNQGRVQMTQEALEAAKAELKDARAALDEARRR